MRVSVIMPVHNGENFLRAGIDSILNQTFTDFELIVIDDGSTDGSRKMVQSYLDRRIKLVINESNLGLVASLNKGIEVSRGEYLARMDADDVSVPERLAKQVGFMDTHPEIGIAGSWIKRVENGNENPVEFPEEPGIIHCRLLFETVLAHPSVIMRKSTLLEHNLKYDFEYERCEDYDLWARASKVTKLANIPEPLVLYSIHAGQVGQRYADMQRRALRRIHERQLRELGINPTSQELDLHRAIGKRIPQFRRSYLKKVDEWVLKLESANEKRRQYPNPPFSKVLAYYRNGADQSVVSFRQWFMGKVRNLGL